MAVSKMLGGASTHAIPALFAAILPYLAFDGAGLALLPAMYLFAFPFRQIIFANYWAMPLFGMLVFVLEKTDVLRGDLAIFDIWSPMFRDCLWAVAPLALSIAFHYLVVAISKSCRESYSKDIDDICTGISDYLVVRCFEQRKLPSFLYMKSERVLIAVSCTLKIILAIAYLVLFPVFNDIPQGCIGCGVKPQPAAAGWLWAMYLIIFVTEVLYHIALFLSGIIRAGVNESFSHIVLCPTYWQWYFVVAYSSSASALWLPFSLECVRAVSVSFFRMQDKEDTLINPLMSTLDLLHALTVLALRGTAADGCVYPVVMLQRQLTQGFLFLSGWISSVLKHQRLHKAATRPIRARIYLPIHHDQIECYKRRWWATADPPRRCPRARGSLTPACLSPLEPSTLRVRASLVAVIFIA